MTDGLFTNEKSAGWVRRNTMLGRGGKTGEVDGALLFLASDASSLRDRADARRRRRLDRSMMLAVQLTEWGCEPQLRDVPVPQPRGEEVLLQVTAAGLCRSDLHVMDASASSYDYPLPLTLGHEVAGTVLDVGPDGDRSWLGEAVVVHGVWGCGRCRNCARGRENYCSSCGLAAGDWLRSATAWAITAASRRR